MIVKAFIYHKRAEKYSDCQDWFGIDSQTNRIAVSDGMSQSIFPQWWAKILVDTYLKEGCIPEDITSQQTEWQEMLQVEIEKRDEEAKINPKRDPWRLRNLLAEKSGAGATLCGLTLGKSRWTCECIGDSCLIAVYDDYSLKFYTSQVGEFGNHPDYFDSFRSGRGKPIREIVEQNVKLLLMVSDPFAEFFKIHENDKGFIEKRLNEIRMLSDHESYVELVEDWRDKFGMHNDDSTLILIEDCSNKKMSLLYADDIESLSVTESKVPQTENHPTITSVIDDTVIEPSGAPQEYNNEGSSHNEAEERFKESGENLMQYYQGKRSKRKITKWLVSKLKPIIDSFSK